MSLRLPTGELEVLVTSLLDETVYLTAALRELYYYRWGQETYCGRWKGRLDLEQGSGATERAIRHDFEATVLVANLESCLCQPAPAHLDAHRGTRQHPAQLNRADRYHALKTRVLELLAGDAPAETGIRELQPWLLANPVSVRPQRQVPRRPPPLARSYPFQRHVRKTVF